MASDNTQPVGSTRGLVPARPVVRGDRQPQVQSESSNSNAVQQQQQKKPTTPKQALKQLQTASELFHSNIQFEKFQKTGEWYVKIIDTRTNKVVNTIPPKDVLEMAAKLRTFVGLLFDKKA